MNQSQRQRLIDLATEAGMSDSNIADLHTCGIHHAGKLFSLAIDDIQPGTLTLSDPRAAHEGLSAYYDICNENDPDLAERDRERASEAEAASR